MPAGAAGGAPAWVGATLTRHFLKGPSWSVVARLKRTMVTTAPAVPKIQAMMAKPRLGPAEILPYTAALTGAGRKQEVTEGRGCPDQRGIDAIQVSKGVPEEGKWTYMICV